MKRLFTISGLLIASLVFGSEPIVKLLNQSYPGNAQLTIPLLKNGEVPSIDGNIDENEWAKAVKIAGFVQEPGAKGIVKGEQGFVYIAGDDKYLYIAVKTTTPIMDPGGGLVAKAMQRDSSVYSDDSVELLFSPDTAPQKCYHIIVNSIGVIFDRVVNFQTHQENNQWNIKKPKIATIAGSGWWHFEIRIPREEIGNPKKQMAFNICRNWAAIGASALNPSAPHANRKRMFLADFAADIPLLKMDNLGSVGEGEWNGSFRITGATPQRPIRLGIRLLQHNYPAGKKPFYLPVKEIYTTATNNKSYEFEYTAEDDKIHSLNCVVQDVNSGKILFRRIINGRKGINSGRIPVTGEIDLENKGVLQYYHYPSYNKVVAKIHTKSKADIHQVDILVKYPNNTTKIISGKMQKGRGEITLNAGPLPGKYQYSISLRDNSHKQIKIKNSFSVEKRTFNWENNSLGKEKIIIPPFKPITTSKNSFSTIYRNHQVNSSGLWDSVTSCGRELLAKPMFYELIVNGKSVRFQGEPANFKIYNNGHDATIINQASFGSLTLKSVSNCEYDGFFYNKIAFDNPQNLKVERLTLQIPLRESEAKLFHAVSDTIRQNPAGAIPQGQGIVWSGDKLVRMTAFGSQLIHPQFVPYIWLGTESRGISFMCNSSYGMRLDKKNPAVRIVRKSPDIVTLELDLINIPTILNAQDKIEFGFMATPVKPVPVESRRLTFNNMGDTINGAINIFSILYSNLGYPYWFHQPLNNDYSLVKSLTQYVSCGSGKAEYEAKAEKFKAKYDRVLENLFKNFSSPDRNGQTYYSWFKRVDNNFLALSLKPHTGRQIPMKYSDPRLIAHIETVPGYFKSEWSTHPVGYVYAYRSYLVPSNLDYLVYCYNQNIVNGISGVYLDDMFIIPNNDPETVARVDRFGQLHSDCHLLALRELVKRIATIQYLNNCSPRYLEIHMTNALLIPCFSFATAQLGWEDKYGESEFQDRFNHENLRTINLGTKLGAASISLDGIYRYTSTLEEWKKNKFRHLSRTHLAMILPHGVHVRLRNSGPYSGIDWSQVQGALEVLRDFGAWEKECKFVPYYDNQGELGNLPNDILASSYRLPGKIAIVLGNLGESKKFKLNLDYVKLKLKESVRYFDGETGNELIDKEVTLPKRDFRIIIVAINKLAQTTQLKENKEMKKLAVSTLAAVALTAIGGEENKIGIAFAKGKTPGTFAYWRQISGEHMKPLGKIEAINNHKVEITSSTKNTIMYTINGLAVNGGEQFRVSADVTGSGWAQIGFYTYGEKWSWQGAVWGKYVKSNGDEAVKAEFIYQIPQKTNRINISLNVYQNSKIKFENIKLERLQKADKEK